MTEPTLPHEYCLYCVTPYQTEDGRIWCPNPECPGNVGNPRPTAKLPDQLKADPQVLVKQLADTLEMDRPWAQLLWEVARLKQRETEKVQVENIISVLAGMDTLSSVMQHIEVQLGDEAIYEHLKTCADIVDEEETKQQLRDLAEIFAFEFCK